MIEMNMQRLEVAQIRKLMSQSVVDQCAYGSTCVRRPPRDSSYVERRAPPWWATGCYAIPVCLSAVRGLEPSTTTASILPKALDQVHAWDEAEPFLAGAPLRFGLRSEARLHAQLAEACMQAGSYDCAAVAFAALVAAADGDSDRRRLRALA